MWALLVLACVIGLSAGLLRRWPRWALAATLGGSLAAVMVPAERWGAIALMLLTGIAGIEVCLIAATRPGRLSAAAAAVAFGGLTISWIYGAQVSADRIMLGPGIPVGLVIVPTTVAIAWLIGHSIRQAHVHAEQLRVRADAQAATAERLRIARELHDLVAHSIGIIAIQAGMGSRVIATQPAEAGQALAAIEATSRQTLAGLRQMLGALRHAESGAGSESYPLDPVPGLADLDRLAEITLDAGVRVDVQRQGDLRGLPAEVDLSAFRIVQEAVTNVVRHAGTGHCQVRIDCRDEELSIEVIDDGSGGVVARAGYGITGMRERASLLGGQCTAGPRPGGGFQVTARLPLPAAVR
ncbi:MAG TPA: sensor histidine kinase [Streptosporangiaceae bacterium]|nr:sensor histidine kinase [Streptosporangiaceae bacterium]